MVFRWISTIALSASIAVVAGILIGLEGGPVALVILGSAAGLAFVARQKPMEVVAIWVITAPFLQGKTINLGPAIPDITADRVFLIILSLMALLRAGQGHLRLWRPRLEDYMLGGFLLFGVISILGSANADTIRQFYFWTDSYLLPVLGYYLIVTIIRTERDMRFLVYAVLIGLLVLTAPAAMEYLSGRTILGEPSQFIQGTFRVRTFTSAAWVLGAFAGMGLPFTLYVANMQVHSYSRAWRLFAAITGVFGVLAVFLTFLRAAWISLLVCLLVLKRSQVWKAVAAMILLGLLFAFLFPTISKTAVWQQRISGGDTVASRIVLAQTQLGLFLESPVIGHGIASVPDRFYVKTVYDAQSQYDVFLPSHDMIATVIVEFGLFGLLYVGAIATILLRGYKAYAVARSDTFWGKPLIAAISASSLAFLVQAVTFETRFFPSITLFFWLMLGLLTVAVGNSAKGATSGRDARAVT